MVGDRFGQSIDIGEELKREEEQESRKQKQQEQQPPSEPSEPQESPSSEPEEPHASEQPSPPDPVEEDVQELLSPPPKLEQRARAPSRKPLIAYLLIILLIGVISLTQSLRIPALEERAEESVREQVFAAARNEVQQRWPLLSKEELDQKTEQLAKNILRDPKTIKNREKLVERYQFLFRTPKGTPYLYDSDAYYFLSRAAGIATMRGDEQKFHPLVALEKSAYRVAAIIEPNITIADAVVFLPLLLGLLSLTVFFFLARHVTNSSETAFFASLVLALQPWFYHGTAAGMLDSQSLNLFFSVLFFFCCACTATAARQRKRSAVWWAVLALVVLLLFNLSWGSGAYYVIAVLGASLSLFFALKFWKARAWTPLIVLLTTCGLASWWIGTTTFGQRVLTYLKFTPQEGILQSIGELTGGDINIFVTAMGGWLPLILAFAAWCWLAHKNIKQQPAFNDILFIVWFALLAFSSYQSVRFTYYALPAEAVLIGFALQHIAKGCCTLLDFTSHKRRLAVQGCLIGVIALLLIPPLLAAQKESVPYMNDAIMSTGMRIASRSPPDARIISWWDLGYLWRFASKRQPYIDGGTQGSKATYWIGRAFLSHDPTEATAIWKMLACRDRTWLDRQSLDDTVIHEGASCVAHPPMYVIATEDMLPIAPVIAVLVSAQDGRLLPELHKPSSLVLCQEQAALLVCGGMAVNRTNLTTHTGIPVHFYQNGTRERSTSTSEEALVVYQSNNKWYAVKTSTWLADTVMLRLFAGESLGMRPFAFTEIPMRIAAYEFTQHIETEQDLAIALAEGLSG